MRTNRTALAAILAALSLCSCGKIQMFSRQEGKPIVFAAPASTAQPETKTSYESGTAQGAIYWNDGDIISIYCEQANIPDHPGKHVAPYVVSPKSDQNLGNLENYIPNALNWGTGPHTFYAFYPAPETPGAGSNYGVNGSTASFVIPAEQNYATKTVTGTTTTTTTLAPNMLYAPMVASTYIANTGGNGEAVPLYFKAGFTAFEFIVRVADADGELRLKEFTFTSAVTNLVAAKATATISGNSTKVSLGTPDLTDPGKVVTIPLGTNEAPLVLSGGNILVFTFFALGAEDIHQATVRFTTTSGFRQLALKYDETYFAAHPELKTEKRADAEGWLIFPKGKKISMAGFDVPGRFYIAFNNITIGGQPYEGKTPGTDWAFVLEEIELASATIGGHTVTDLGSDSGWDLVSYTLALEQAVINGQNVTNYSSDSAWKPVLEPIEDLPGITTGGQGYDNTKNPGTSWSLTVND